MKEAWVRCAQEASKYRDLALYRTEFTPWENLPTAAFATEGKFLFGESAEQIAHRAALLREHMPAEVERVIEEADGICRHEFDLLGYQKLCFKGDRVTEIDWHLDPVHAKRSPLAPWFKINFLNFQEVGDHKIIWELNRHQHLVTLGKAWCLTGDENYAQEIVSQWYSWKKANPYPLGINWASALEVAFRAISWLWLRAFLAGCSTVPPTFDADLLRALQVHGRYISCYLSTYFSPNTHLIGEAFALFYIGTLCPQLPLATRWRDEGWEILLQESTRQVRPDGVYFEQALYYHVYALDFFLHARKLANDNGLVIPQSFDDVLNRMLEVIEALSNSGSIEGFGDDDGGRVFNPRRNRIQHMTDPLALGSLIFDCKDYHAADLTEEAIWLFGDKAIQILRQPPSPVRTASRAFPSGGIFLINDDLPNPQQMMIDAGPQGTGHSGHGHADGLSLRFSVPGRRILVDPGTFCYISGNDDRALFRGTAAHNTLQIDGLDQAVPEGPFAWSSIPSVTTETWIQGETFDYFVGSHDGYQRLQHPVRHRRSVFHVKGGVWVIRDVAEGQGAHLLETFWHFAPDLEVTPYSETKEQPSTFLIRSSDSDNDSKTACAALLFSQDSSWKPEISRNFVSPAYGSRQLAPVLRASARATLPQESVVLLVPGHLAFDVGKFISIPQERAPEKADELKIDPVCAYRYETLHSTELLFFAPVSSIPWECGPWSSNASLLYCKVQAGRLVHVIMVVGSFAAWHGSRFVSLPSVIPSLEWSSGQNWRASSSPQSNSAAPDAVTQEFRFSESTP